MTAIETILTRKYWRIDSPLTSGPLSIDGYTIKTAKAAYWWAVKYLTTNFPTVDWIADGGLVATELTKAESAELTAGW